MVTAQVEPWLSNVAELKGLIGGHYEELALDKEAWPLDPRWDVYEAEDRAGVLLFVTLREAGRLVGYFIGNVAPGKHYKTCLTCVMDIFYVHPDFRKGRSGLILFKAVEHELRRRGVNRWFVGTKLHKSAAVLFKRLKFVEIETYYSKRLV